MTGARISALGVKLHGKTNSRPGRLNHRALLPGHRIYIKDRKKKRRGKKTEGKKKSLLFKERKKKRKERRGKEAENEQILLSFVEGGGPPSHGPAGGDKKWEGKKCREKPDPEGDRSSNRFRPLLKNQNPDSSPK